MRIKKECIVCEKTIMQDDDILQCCCGNSMFPKHDVDMFREAGWIKSNEKSKIKMSGNLPEFIRLGKGGTAMRLSTSWLSGKRVYYRAGGRWETEFRVDKKSGKVFSDFPDMPHIHNKELIPTTEEDWAKDNGQYAYR